MGAPITSRSLACQVSKKFKIHKDLVVPVMEDLLQKPFTYDDFEEAIREAKKRQEKSG